MGGCKLEVVEVEAANTYCKTNKKTKQNKTPTVIQCLNLQDLDFICVRTKLYSYFLFCQREWFIIVKQLGRGQEICNLHYFFNVNVTLFQGFVSNTTWSTAKKLVHI